MPLRCSANGGQNLVVDIRDRWLICQHFGDHFRNAKQLECSTVPSLYVLALHAARWPWNAYQTTSTPSKSVADSDFSRLLNLSFNKDLTRSCWSYSLDRHAHDRVQLRNRPLRTSWASAVPAAMQYLVLRLQRCRARLLSYAGLCWRASRHDSFLEFTLATVSKPLTCPPGCLAGSCEVAQGRCGPPQGQSIPSTARLCVKLRLQFIVKCAREKSSV